MSPPPGTSILAIALPAGTSYEPKARGWPGGGWAQLELTDTLYTQARHAIKYTQLFYIQYTQSLSSECKVNCNIMWNSFILI